MNVKKWRKKFVWVLMTDMILYKTFVMFYFIPLHTTYDLLVYFADHHGPPRVNVWQDPMSPSKWKEEHVSLVF